MRPRKDRTMATRGKTPAPTGEPLVQLIPIDKVTPPSENRDDLGDMEQLIASVKARGVSQAILVRPNEDGTYQIVFGERRWRAAKQAGHTTIKAEIRQLDDLDAALEQIAENMDRKDLTSLEKAKALRRALDAAKRQGVRLGQREWAARLGKSQATVSKYLTLLVIYNEFPAFKQAYDAGQATDTDAVHLGRLVRQVGKEPELVERVLSRGLRFGVENEVNTELKSHERRQARAKVMAELEEHGVILAPDDWRSTTARSLAALGLDPEAHASQPCHAVWVDSASQLDPICMSPERHTPPPANSPSPAPGGGPGGVKSSPDAKAMPSARDTSAERVRRRPPATATARRPKRPSAASARKPSSGHGRTLNAGSVRRRSGPEPRNWRRRAPSAAKRSRPGSPAAVGCPGRCPTAICFGRSSTCSVTRQRTRPMFAECSVSRSATPAHWTACSTTPRRALNSFAVPPSPSW